MPAKRYLSAAAAIFGILFVSDFLVHAVLLKDAYRASAYLWRPMPEMQRLMWVMWVLYLVDALVLPYMYDKGYERGKSAAVQGIKFGLLIGLLMSSGMSLGTYFMVSLPVKMAATWFVAGMIEFALVGLAIGLIHKPKAVMLE